MFFFVLICAKETLYFEVKLRLNRLFEVKFEVKKAQLTIRIGWAFCIA